MIGVRISLRPVATRLRVQTTRRCGAFRLLREHHAHAHAATQVTIALFVAQEPGKVRSAPFHRHRVFELHHHIQRNPIVIPTPGVELRVVGGTQVQVPIVPQQFAADTRFVSGPCNVRARRGGCTRSGTSWRNQSRVRATRTWLGCKPLLRGVPGTSPVRAIRRSLYRLAGTASCGCVCACFRTPGFLVEQDDADVRPKTVPVKHNQTPNF